MCKDCKDLEPFTKEGYEALKSRAEAIGLTVITKWRKGLKHVQLGDIVLSESTPVNHQSNKEREV